MGDRHATESCLPELEKMTAVRAHIGDGGALLRHWAMGRRSLVQAARIGLRGGAAAKLSVLMPGTGKTSARAVVAELRAEAWASELDGSMNVREP